MQDAFALRSNAREVRKRDEDDEELFQVKTPSSMHCETRSAGHTHPSATSKGCKALAIGCGWKSITKRWKLRGKKKKPTGNSVAEERE